MSKENLGERNKVISIGRMHAKPAVVSLYANQIKGVETRFRGGVDDGTVRVVVSVPPHVDSAELAKEMVSHLAIRYLQPEDQEV